MRIQWFEVATALVLLGVALGMRLRAARRWRALGEVELAADVRQAVDAWRAAGDCAYVLLLIVLGRFLSGAS